MIRISPALRGLVRARAHNRCEYCQTSEWLSGLPCEIDHILPRSAGGLTTDDNFAWLALPAMDTKEALHALQIRRRVKRSRCFIPGNKSGANTWPGARTAHTSSA